MRSGEIWQNGKRQEETFDILSTQVGKMKKKEKGVEICSKYFIGNKKLKRKKRGLKYYKLSIPE